jgi:hypothetical protein
MPCPHGKKFPCLCKECGSGPKKCEHGKRTGRCVECGGSQICQHKRIKYDCVDCKGSSLCSHSLVKSECRACGGSRFCEHGKRKASCAVCGGSALCIHGVSKRTCKPCGGSAYCDHGRIQTCCKECKGSSICEHNKLKYYCKICDGRKYCIHDKIKRMCRICDGRGFCEHDKIKDICKTCKGASICKHNKHKNYCKECGGSACCKSSWCSTIPSNPRYDGYCLVCYVHLFPDKPVLRNYKTKERSVATFIKETFPDLTWMLDKKVADGCSFKRPDLLCDLGEQVLIVEIDEDQHEKYDCSCENKRLMEISRDVGHRPLVFIRFNPDKYTSLNGEEHASCWSPNKYGTCSIVKRDEWAKRLTSLKDTIQYWLINRTDKTVEVVQLYYS